MTYEQILEKIAEESKTYEDFHKYTADAGWQLWMNDYTEAEDSEECSESELKKIEAIQKEGWNRSHC